MRILFLFRASFAGLICFISLMAVSVVAGAAGQKPITDKWKFEVIPYIWTMSIDGTLGAGGQTTELDVSFSDMLEVTDFAGSLAFTARKNRWGIYGNLLVAKMSDTIETSIIDIDWETDFVNFEFGVGYRFSALGPVEVIVGGRYWGLENDIDFQPGPSVSDSQSWIDPIIGLGLRYDITDKFEVAFSGGIGGFGIGADFTWEIEAYAAYNFTHWLALSAGYRHLVVDYKDDDFLFDVTLDGMALAVRFTF